MSEKLDGKTLADVQPGGRVRLGDQAERARFEAWAKDRGHDLSVTHGHPIFIDGLYEDSDTYAAWVVWQAALSAQPSPGGQAAHCPVKHCGMTYARVPADGRCHACGATVQPSPGGQDALVTDAMVYAAEEAYANSKPDNLHESFRAAIAAALAARQPVGAVRQGCDACHRTGIRQNDEGRNICCPDCDLGRACAGDTRQPVGEPVADECEGCKGGIRYDAQGCSCMTCGKRPKWYMAGRRIRVTERRKPWRHLGAPVPFEAECTWQMGDSIDYRLDGETTSRRLNNFHQHWEKVEVIR